MTVEVIDDILQWMLDGWYFGQSSSQQPSTTTLQIKPSSVQRGSLLAKANTVQTHSNAVAAALNASSQREEQKAKLEAMQTTTKYGLFCLTFSVSRGGMSLISDRLGTRVLLMLLTSCMLSNNSILGHYILFVNKKRLMIYHREANQSRKKEGK